MVTEGQTDVEVEIVQYGEAKSALLQYGRSALFASPYCNSIQKELKIMQNIEKNCLEIR